MPTSDVVCPRCSQADMVELVSALLEKPGDARFPPAASDVLRVLRLPPKPVAPATPPVRGEKERCVSCVLVGRFGSHA